MPGTDKDYYHILNVNRNATASVIKKSFYRLALQHHPDRNSNTFSDAIFKEINEAYQCLSDPVKRQRYDALYHGSWNHIQLPQAYFKAEVSINTIKLNEELEITYRYAGEGRFFKKPPSAYYVFTSGPVVSHYTVFTNGLSVRETSLTYTMSAIKKGEIIIQPATIDVQQKHLTSKAFTINVLSNTCYFKPLATADSNPFVVRLFKEQFSSNSIYRKTNTYRHTILVPRSHYAAFYHSVGYVMKITFALCGMILFILNDYNFLMGFICGSLVAGINCQMMYWLSGVRSKYFYAQSYPLVKHYMESGYQMGNYSSHVLINDTLLQRFVHLFK